MRVVCVSDTHGRLFRPLVLPEGDVLAVSGDICLHGNLDELRTAAKWLGGSRNQYKEIIVVAGNHDFPFQEHPEEAREILASESIKYLEDQELLIDGVKFYGSPWTPTFFEWAFMKDRGPEIRAVWEKIPHDTDVLITHGPPMGILDKNAIWGDMCGCADLRDIIFDGRLERLKLVTFGHIHEGYGTWAEPGGEGPIFVNASVCNEAYSPINKPIVVEIE